jgi:hypothetical protein
MTKLMLISATAFTLFIHGQALAIDRLSALGGLNPLKPMPLQHVPSEKEEKLLHQIYNAEDRYREATLDAQAAATKLKELGCDAEAGVWTDECDKTIHILAANKRYIPLWLHALQVGYKDLETLKTDPDAYVKPVEIPANTENQNEQNITGEATDEDNSGPSEADLEAAFPDPVDEASDDATGDNTAATEPETAQEPADQDNSGASEVTDEDNTVATDSDDTEDGSGAFESDTTENNNAANEPNDKGNSEADLDAETAAICASNPDCQME